MMKQDDTLHVYLVSRCESDYEGSYFWPVKAFLSEDRAREYANFCNEEIARLRELKEKDRAKFYLHLQRPIKPNPNWDEDYFQSIHNRYDTDCSSCNFDDIDYDYGLVPLDVEA